ncbi:MAG: response regulator, partial [Bacteroidota bacterium]
YPGSGIGLALTKELVKLMDGQITVESTKGKGSTFTILIPIRKNVRRTGIPEQIASSAHVPYSFGMEDIPLNNSDSNLLQTPILLLVEDNLDVLNFLSKQLKTNYQVHFARNGVEGIEKALALIPDIIISDVMMPEKDGFELCATLKQDERTSHIPIILLTAKVDMNSKLEGLTFGADAYLSKPFHHQELNIRLQKLLELRQKLQEKYNQVSFITEAITEREDTFVMKVKRLILDHLDDETFGVEELAAAVHYSKVHVYRKLKALTGKSTSHFIRQVRLQEAFKLLQSTDLSVSEVAYTVGFADISYFSKVFSNHFGKPPSKIIDQS